MWLRGLVSVTKRHLMVVAARNLSVIMRSLFGIGTPRGLQGLCALARLAWTYMKRLMIGMEAIVGQLMNQLFRCPNGLGG
jgi:hypothetical protein